jgi:hypothetical protein
MGGLGSALRGDLLTGGRLAPAIAHELQAGRLCVIRDAIARPLADELHACLDAHDAWESLEVFKQPYTAYKNLGVFDRARFPAPLQRFEAMFGSEESRALIGEASGADTSGPVEMHASLFTPGCYQLPHTDFGSSNTVSFIWNLTRVWEPSWGGHFFWCSPPTNIVPTFNTLILFRPSNESFHFTCPVAPHAQGKRLAVTGWWTGAGEPARPPAPGAWYRGPLREIGRGVFAV